MIKIEEELKEKIKEIEKIRLVSAVYKKEEKICYLNFLIPNLLTDEIQKQAVTICSDNLKTKCAIKFKKAIYDAEAVIYVIKNYLKEKYSNILEMLDNKDLIITKNENEVEIKFILFEDLKNLAEKNGFVKHLQESLQEHFFENFTIVFEEKQIENIDEILENKKAKIENQAPVQKKDNLIRLKVDGVEALIGDLILTPPVAISCVKKPCEEIYLAGKIQFFNKRTFKKKNKEGKEEEKPFFTFVINDSTGNISCTYFPTSATEKKMEKLCDGTNIICYGKIETFNDRLSFRPKDISLCLSFEPIQKKIEYNKVAQNYTLIFPQEFKKERQLNLLGEEVASQTVIPEYLKNNKIVVFDLETTGLFAEKHEIIEIGACKIENGEITQIFETLIKPEENISEEITNITNITNEMVSESPKFEDVVGDFYKFCDGCVMVAYNANFDKSFIDFHSEKCLYQFKNKVVDCMIVAQQQLKGLRNYKLKTVLEKLNIVNEGAHRAYHDAIATAKAFIVLAEKL